MSFSRLAICRLDTDQLNTANVQISVMLSMVVTAIQRGPW